MPRGPTAPRCAPPLPRQGGQRRASLEAARNAVLETWSNGQTEGQVNKLTTLKRAMYGRAGVDLLRARMMPLQDDSMHQK
jgi:transposase